MEIAVIGLGFRLGRERKRKWKLMEIGLGFRVSRQDHGNCNCGLGV